MDETIATIDDAAVTAPSSAAAVTDELLDDELLVEEISIDGMCGVY
jgi:mycofactocin precursor